MKPPRKKREPTLADEILAPAARIVNDYMGEWVDEFKTTLRVAKKFTLDDDATRHLGQVMKENPRLIADAQDFAIPPFRWMWIEFSSSTLYQALLGKSQALHGLHGVDETTKLGFLLDGPRVRMALSSGGKRALVPVEFVLHRPMPEWESKALKDRLGIGPLQLDILFWGELCLQFTGQDAIHEDDSQDDWDVQSLESLRANHTLRLVPTQEHIESKGSSALEAASAASGMLRDIIALLLFLNRTRDIQYVRDFPHAQGFVNKKLRPLVAHSVISLSMNPKDRFVTLTAGEGVKRRLHDVRGHFCHDRTARSGCLHGEQLMHDFGDWWEEYQPLKWKCSGCGGLRWWRREHKRGHHEDGLVLQQYAVTA